MTTQEITARIEQVKKNKIDNEARLEQLRVERSQLAIEDSTKNAATIKKLDNQIADVRRDIENHPIELRMLGEQLTKAQAEEAQAAKNALLSQQKSAAARMETLSKKLVAALEVAYDLNLQLTASTDRYCALLKQTGQDISMKATCRPSEQMLKVIYETCKAELSGIQQPRTSGQPPYVRI